MSEEELTRWSTEISRYLANGDFGKVKSVIETIYNANPTAFYELYERLMCDRETRELLAKEKGIFELIASHLPRSIKTKFYQVKQYLDSDCQTYHSRIDLLLSEEEKLETYSEIIVWLSSLLEKHVLQDAADILSKLTGASRDKIRDEVQRSNILALGLLFIYFDQCRISLADEVKNRLIDIPRFRNSRIHHKYEKIEKMKCYQLLESFSDIVVKWQSLKSIMI